MCDDAAMLITVAIAIVDAFAAAAAAAVTCTEWGCLADKQKTAC